jgi:hypothetical protein
MAPDPMPLTLGEPFVADEPLVTFSAPFTIGLEDLLTGPL